jgi:drug/metabolite transporter (DMT)-like permease
MMHTDNPRGIVAMLSSMALFVGNDAIMKFVSGSVPLVQAIFIRGALVTLLLVAVAGAQGKLRYVHTLADRNVVARGVLEAVGSYAYLVSLMYIPLAIALGINMATPLVVLPFAVLLLNEQVRWRRWSALAVGFVGVLLIVQPGPDGVDWWVLLALAGTVVLALRDVTTRRIPVAIPSILVTTFCGAILTLSSGALVLYQGWQAIGPGQLAGLAAAAVMVGGGMHLLVVGTRIGEASVIAGFRYTALLWGVILGYAIWGDLPGPVAWAGIALIVGSGLYAAHRERVRLLEARIGQ